MHDHVDHGASLAVQVADRLRQALSEGRWPVGTRIPSEKQLAESFGVSRNTAREALRSLTVSGLLEPRVGDGTYVRSVSELEGAFARSVLAAEAYEVFEVRSMLEEHGARLAAVNGTNDQLHAVREALDARDTSTDLRDFIDNDIRFHRLILEAAGNHILGELHRSLTGIDAHLRDYACSAGSVEEFVKDNSPLIDTHRELLNALVDRDPQRAKHLAGEIVREGGKAVITRIAGER